MNEGLLIGREKRVVRWFGIWQLAHRYAFRLPSLIINCAYIQSPTLEEGRAGGGENVTETELRIQINVFQDLSICSISLERPLNVSAVVKFVLSSEAPEHPHCVR
ncbi:hypothetical protein GJAV_G00260320 [Gymnothorax javanicus]|nr:hypothetical protein GJAV_G00260320 [Gymnothorax javanicus]